MVTVRILSEVPAHFKNTCKHNFEIIINKSNIVCSFSLDGGLKYIYNLSVLAFWTPPDAIFRYLRRRRWCYEPITNSELTPGFCLTRFRRHITYRLGRAWLITLSQNQSETSVLWSQFNMTVRDWGECAVCEGFTSYTFFFALLCRYLTDPWSEWSMEGIMVPAGQLLIIMNNNHHYHY